ncbi:MAG TPA: PH domain-containing protein [Roseiflexaceae bacterium]|nr:PH domain-containing protein [Roseiflexaceae bacterium]
MTTILEDLNKPQIDLELDEGEMILYIGRRHWIELVQNGGVFIVIMLISTLLAIYRGIGGSFIVNNVAEPGLDTTNVLLLVVIGALVVLWQRGIARQRENRNRLNLSLFYFVTIGALSALFFFRLQGGRVIYIDPLDARPFDTYNLLLIVTALVMAGIMFYLYVDWVDDYLVLTNTRVVYDDNQMLVRHIKQQILLDDIQQVNMIADNYLAHWFGYGQIVIRSFSPRRLVFNYAAKPSEIEKNILAEVNKLRSQQSTDMLRQLIEDRVYHNKPPKKPGPAIHVQERSGPIPWLFKPNPEIDFEKEVIIWRPAWIFLALALLRPVSVFLLVLVLLGIAASFEIVPAIWMTAIGLLALGSCGFWAFWVYEEHEHDLYILTRRDITDLDKKPFGPESRRRAPLSAIQDVSFDVSFLEASLGFGTIVIETGGAAGGRFTFNHVPDPRNVQATINDYLTDFKKNEKERQFQDAVTLLHEYHQLQVAKGELADQKRIAAIVTETVREQNGQQPRTAEPTLAPEDLERVVREAVQAEMMRLRGRASGQQ